MNIIVIPARMGSKRLPQKPLIPIDGKQMIIRVAEQGAKSECADKVVVATDNKRIAATVWAHKFDKPVGVKMTNSNCKTGTDRIASLAYGYMKPDDIVVNLQGDLPFADPRICDQLFDFMADNPNALMATVVNKRKLPEHTDKYEGTDSVKVVVDSDMKALYFSRRAIPYGSEALGYFYHHIGMYAYRVDTLKILSGMSQPGIEQLECLEQLRAIYGGIGISVVETGFEAGAEINTREDWELVRKPSDWWATEEYNGAA